MSKVAFRESYLVFDGDTYYLTDMSLSDNFDEIDVTDTGTEGQFKDFVGGFRDATVQFTIILDPTASEPAMNTLASASANFEGMTYEGNLRLLTKTVSGSVGSAVTVQYTGRFTSLS
jgi:hypothetical protein